MSQFTEIELFELLKKSIAKRFFEKNVASSEDISQWKGRDILDFQEDLLSAAKSTVSEKWFYTYFKSDFKKLPRIDMLNILAEYCGYSNWADFISQQGETEEETKTETIQKRITHENTVHIEPKVKADIAPSSKKKRTKLIEFILFPLIALSGIGMVIYYSFFQQKDYEFCFIDGDRTTAIKNTIEVTILREGFTPLFLTTKTGCIRFPSYEDTLKMYVSSPYHKKDTFLINLHQYRNPEKIILEPDDYKVMLYYYSRSSEGVKERIEKLNSMISDKALIYQVYDNDYFGVEILSKQQYINLVSLPTTSLKNYSLIESEMKNGKIVKLKFKIQADEN